MLISPSFFRYSSTTASRRARMVDINIAFVFQLVNFIVLLIALNFILFKPLRAIMRERDETIGGALADAKQKAAQAYNTLYQQGLDAQRDMIAAERAKAGELLDGARKEIASAAEAARGDLKKEAEKLSLEISGKLLGRAV